MMSKLVERIQVIRGEKPIEIVDISYPMSFHRALEIRNEYESKNYWTEIRPSDDGTKRIYLLIYEKIIVNKKEG